TVCRKIPTLGVCLGHQAICAAYGAKLTYANTLMHGKQSVISFCGNSPIFRDIPENVPVARYHSLAADPATLPDCLEVTAIADDGEIMAVQHREYPIYGVQFHPESIMTPDGKTMLTNFINL
ncbi:MAG: gamma-glutamyl-gamma-aminobutyrate hydrolase family protein, partial [Ruminococcus sp.]|nr:gamma-glutamyl-gamma-aminobutyrate hydrolase family protein [Ruminococcus sp.]